MEKSTRDFPPEWEAELTGEIEEGVAKRDLSRIAHDDS